MHCVAADGGASWIGWNNVHGKDKLPHSFSVSHCRNVEHILSCFMSVKHLNFKETQIIMCLWMPKQFVAEFLKFNSGFYCTLKRRRTAERNNVLCGSTLSNLLFFNWRMPLWYKLSCTSFRLEPNRLNIFMALVHCIHCLWALYYVCTG